MNPLRITRIACALLAALALLASACGDSRRPVQMQPMQAAELAERLRAGSTPIILDVRTRREYEEGHIPGAINIPYRQLSRRLAELGTDKATEIVVLCWSGERASHAEEILIRAGYTNVRDLQGHMRAWRANGYPSG